MSNRKYKSVPVFDPDLGGDWDAKLSHEDIDWSGKTVHLFRC